MRPLHGEHPFRPRSLRSGDPGASPAGALQRALVLVSLVVTTLASGQTSEIQPPSSPPLSMDTKPTAGPSVAAPEPAKHVLSVGNQDLGGHIGGRFDINYEWLNPGASYPAGQSRVVSYHHFVIVEAHAGPVSFDGEITQLLWYEGRVQVGKGWSIVAGKILVPFGAPGWHRYYGGLQGDPLVGIFLPVVWAELGAEVDWEGFHSGDFSFSAQAYVVRGFGEAPDLTPATQNASSVDDRFAPGGRINLGFGKMALYLSGYGTKWPPAGNWLYILGADFWTEWGLVDVPFVRDLRLRVGVAYANWDRGPTAPPGRLWRYGSYAELDWRSPWLFYLRGRYGIYVHDARQTQARDLKDWNVAVVLRLPYGLYTFAEYQWNREGQDERQNDLMRIGVALDF